MIRPRRRFGLLPLIQPLHVAAWVEDLSRRYAAPTVKQHLAAVRVLFDWLVTGQPSATILRAAVRAPGNVVRKGTTHRFCRLILDHIPRNPSPGSVTAP